VRDIHSDCRVGEGSNGLNKTGDGCVITIKPDKDMHGEVYLYYELTNFYQNHRRYVKSRSDAELRGDNIDEKISGGSGIRDCNPLSTFGQLQQTSQDHIRSEAAGSFAGADIENIRLSPCGLIAGSFFNDWFHIENADYKLEDWDIAWPTDKTKKFLNQPNYPDRCMSKGEGSANRTWHLPTISVEKRTFCLSDLYHEKNGDLTHADGVPRGLEQLDPSRYEDGQIVKNRCAVQKLDDDYGGRKNEDDDGKRLGPCPGVQNEHFIVWMRTAGLPDFRKLFAKVKRSGTGTDGPTIKKGTELKFTIDSRFRVQPYHGTKSIVLSTTSAFGGKNNFLGMAYIVVGVICFVLGTIFMIKHVVMPRKLGDTQYLVWREKSSD